MLNKLTSKPTFVSLKIFNEDLAAIHKIKEVLTMNKPIIVGMCILDLSKVCMYDFHYNHMKHKYGDKAKLLFTDTDSLTYEIEVDDVYQDFWNDGSKFAFSDCPENSPFHSTANKKVSGKMSYEACGVPIIEFIGLRSKMYSYLKDNETGDKKAEGIKTCVVKNNIRHEDYRKVLFNDEQLRHKMKSIRSIKHQIASYEINKVSLSCFDDKRYILENGIDTLAYGHYKISEPFNNQIVPSKQL